jgi:DNA-binding GntR family transcriptional regulator
MRATEKVWLRGEGLSKRAASGVGNDKKERAEPHLYQIVVKTLQSEIVRGLYPVGSQLPSEAALVERFNVSRHTVREALRALREAGLVKSHQGLGTLVQRPGSSEGFVHHINTISDLFPVSVKTQYQVTDGTLIVLPRWAEFFPEIEASRTWLQVHGLRFKSGSDTPFNEVSTFVAARFAGVGRVIGTHGGSIYGAIEMIYGETMNEVEQVIGSFVADEQRGAAIGMKPGDVGVEVSRLFRIASDHDVALLSFNRYRPEDFTFSMSLRRVR